MVESFVLLERLYALLELAEITVKESVGGPLCKEECGRCCEVNVPLCTAVEAKLLLSSVGLLPRQAGVRDRAVKWLRRQEPGVRRYGQGAARAPADQQEMVKDMEKVGGSRCPLLDQTRCIVHNSRPMACRTYGVTAIPNEWCPRPLHFSEAPRRRMMVLRGTKLGGKIQEAYDIFWHHLCTQAPDLRRVGFLPTHIVAVLDVQQLTVERVADSKLLSFYKPGDPFGGQPVDYIGEELPVWDSLPKVMK
ncbi:hypothetical protein LCGC14_1904430 [marine sediment metagenome]|uniref:Zinc/iron-chelating domain-containing protein n=1 Tax=marine sediment metagenome TaxID=412755 RepID=A0A0F9I9H4_9ZZZZ